VQRIVELWDRYLAVMDIVRKLHPTQEDVDSIDDKIAAFYTFYCINFKSSESHYLHILRDHVGDKLRYCWAKWGIGLGFFSTQASEHGNKIVKTALRSMAGFTKTERNKFDMYIDNQLVRLLYFSETVRKPVAVKDKCGACGVVGHRKTNRACAEFRVSYPVGVVRSHQVYGQVVQTGFNVPVNMPPIEVEEESGTEEAKHQDIQPPEVEDHFVGVLHAWAQV
jgi:hypothetical protein